MVGNLNASEDPFDPSMTILWKVRKRGTLDPDGLGTFKTLKMTS